MRESRTYGSGRGACHEMHVPTATSAASSSRCSAARRRRGRSRRARSRPAMPVIGFLSSSPEAGGAPHRCVSPGSEGAGYARGPQRRDRISLGGGQVSGCRELAADLVRRQVAVIAAIRAPLRRWRPKQRPQQFRSFSDGQRSGRLALSPASTGRAATLRADLFTGSLGPNDWSCCASWCPGHEIACSWNPTIRRAGRHEASVQAAAHAARSANQGPRASTAAKSMRPSRRSHASDPTPSSSVPTLFSSAGAHNRRTGDAPCRAGDLRGREYVPKPAADELRSQPYRMLSSGRCLRRSHSQGREAGRFPVVRRPNSSWYQS